MSAGQSELKVYCGPWGPRTVLRYRRLPVDANPMEPGGLPSDEPLSDAVGHVLDQTADKSVLFLPDTGPALRIPSERVESLTLAGQLRTPPASKAGRIRPQKRLRYAADSAMWRLDGWWALRVSDLDLRWLVPAQDRPEAESEESASAGSRHQTGNDEVVSQIFAGADAIGVHTSLCPISPDDWVIVRVGAVSCSLNYAVEVLTEALPGTPRWIIGADAMELGGDWGEWVSLPWYNHLMIR